MVYGYLSPHHSFYFFSFSLSYTHTHTYSSMDKGYLLTATPPDLEHGIAPLGPPAPMQPLLLGGGVCLARGK